MSIKMSIVNVCNKIAFSYGFSRNKVTKEDTYSRRYLRFACTSTQSRELCSLKKSTVCKLLVRVNCFSFVRAINFSIFRKMYPGFCNNDINTHYISEQLCVWHKYLIKINFTIYLRILKRYFGKKRLELQQCFAWFCL